MTLETTLEDKCNDVINRLLVNIAQAWKEGDYSQALNKTQTLMEMLKGILIITQLVKS